jgi:cell division protein FtsN
MFNGNSWKLIKLTLLFVIFFFVVKAPDLFAASYVIHISSFQKEENATVDQERLKKKELPAFIKMVKINNKGIWYRVLIGPYSDYNNAVNTVKTLTRKKLA